MNKKIEKDERATFVENVSYKFGYHFITYALLLDVIYRGLRFNEAPWDLLAIIIISGLVATVYQYKQKILDKKFIKFFVLTFLSAFAIAYLLAFIVKIF